MSFSYEQFWKKNGNINSLAIGINSGAALMLSYSYEKHNQYYENVGLVQVYLL